MVTVIVIHHAQGIELYDLEPKNAKQLKLWKEQWSRRQCLDSAKLFPTEQLPLISYHCRGSSDTSVRVSEALSGMIPKESLLSPRTHSQDPLPIPCSSWEREKTGHCQSCPMGLAEVRSMPARPKASGVLAEPGLTPCLLLGWASGTLCPHPIHQLPKAPAFPSRNLGSGETAEGWEKLEHRESAG